MKTTEDKFNFAAEVIEFLDNHEDWSNIHKADVLAICMGRLLARMRPNVMKSIMPQYLKDVERYAAMYAALADGKNGAAKV